MPGGGGGCRSKSRSPSKCAIYNVNVSSLSSYLINGHRNLFLFRSYILSRVCF